MKIVAGMAAEVGVPCEVSMEKRMACGIGACLSCVVDTVDGKKRACVDGPVFDARKVVVVDGDDGRGSAYDSPHKRAHGREPGRPRDEEPSHGGVGHVRRRARVRRFRGRGPPSARSLRRACRSPAGRATPALASPRRPRACSTPSGCRTPGVAHLKECDLPWLEERGATVIVNVSGHSFDEYVQVIEALEDAPVDAYEVNISCPNVDAGRNDHRHVHLERRGGSYPGAARPRSDRSS